MTMLHPIDSAPIFRSGAPMHPSLRLAPDSGAEGNGSGTGTVDRAVIDNLTDKPLVLDGKAVSIGGKTYTATQIQDMEKKAAEAETLRPRAAAADAAEKDLKAIYGKDATDVGQAKESMFRSLRRAGWSEAEAREQAESVYKPVEGTKKVEDDGEIPEAMKKTAETLQRQLAQQLDEHIEDTAKDHMAQGPMKDLVDGLTRRDGDKAPPKITKLLEWVDQELRLLLKQKMNDAGQFNRAWVRELAPIAAKNVAERAAQLTGDPKTLGRTPDALGDPYRDTLNSKPVPRAEYKDGIDNGTLDKNIGDRMTDRLVRAAAERAVAGAKGVA